MIPWPLPRRRRASTPLLAAPVHHVSWQAKGDSWPHVVDCMNAADVSAVVKALEGAGLIAVAWDGDAEPGVSA